MPWNLIITYQDALLIIGVWYPYGRGLNSFNLNLRSQCICYAIEGTQRLIALDLVIWWTSVSTWIYFISVNYLLWALINEFRLYRFMWRYGNWELLHKCGRWWHCNKEWLGSIWDCLCTAFNEHTHSKPCCSHHGEVRCHNVLSL